MLEKYGRERDDWGKTVEGLVLFTSPEIADGKEEALESVLNTYGSTHIEKGCEERNAVKIVREFFEEEVGNGSELWLCRVNVNDFSECFEKVGQVLLRLHPPSKYVKTLQG